MTARRHVKTIEETDQIRRAFFALLAIVSAAA